MKKITYYGVWALLIGLAIMFLTLALNSCAITKAKQSKSVDSTHVNRTDSGAVKSNSNTEKNRADWERQTLIFNHKDTAIYNYIYSGSSTPLSSGRGGGGEVFDYSRLAAIITERGSSQQEKQNNNYDSSWQNKIDSLKLFIAETSKNKEEKALSLWQIIGLCAGVCIAFLLLSKIKFSLRG